MMLKAAHIPSLTALVASAALTGASCAAIVLLIFGCELAPNPSTAHLPSVPAVAQLNTVVYIGDQFAAEQRKLNEQDVADAVPTF